MLLLSSAHGCAEPLARGCTTPLSLFRYWRGLRFCAWRRLKVARAGHASFTVRPARASARTRAPLPPCRYTFSLEDAIDDCPEYLVHLPTLEELGAKFGLRVVRATGKAGRCGEATPRIAAIEHRLARTLSSAVSDADCKAEGCACRFPPDLEGVLRSLPIQERLLPIGPHESIQQCAWFQRSLRWGE